MGAAGLGCGHLRRGKADGDRAGDHLRDVQAVRRRHELKRRDDPTDSFVLLLADTRHNGG
jgi:hypothetical protein